MQDTPFTASKHLARVDGRSPPPRFWPIHLRPLRCVCVNHARSGAGTIPPQCAGMRPDPRPRRIAQGATFLYDRSQEHHARRDSAGPEDSGIIRPVVEGQRTAVQTRDNARDRLSARGPTSARNSKDTAPAIRRPYVTRSRISTEKDAPSYYTFSRATSTAAKAGRPG